MIKQPVQEEKNGVTFHYFGCGCRRCGIRRKKAYDGYQKVRSRGYPRKAKERYEEHKEKFEQAEAQTSSKLTTLGNKELEIGKDFSEFDRIAAELPGASGKEGNKDLKLSVPQHNINKIKNPPFQRQNISVRSLLPEFPGLLRVLLCIAE